MAKSENKLTVQAQQMLTDEVKAARLLMIEERIGEHMAGMYRSALGIGRCLVEAKDAALVPHGEWESWLKRVAGMTPRTAQRLMQAARETPKGSVMGLIPSFSKSICGSCGKCSEERSGNSMGTSMLTKGMVHPESATETESAATKAPIFLIPACRITLPS